MRVLKASSTFSVMSINYSKVHYKCMSEMHLTRLLYWRDASLKAQLSHHLLTFGHTATTKFGHDQ